MCDKVGLFPGSFVEVGVLRVVACASLTAVVTVNCDAYCSLSVCVCARARMCDSYLCASELTPLCVIASFPQEIVKSEVHAHMRVKDNG